MSLGTILRGKGDDTLTIHNWLDVAPVEEILTVERNSTAGQSTQVIVFATKNWASVQQAYCVIAYSASHILLGTGHSSDTRIRHHADLAVTAVRTGAFMDRIATCLVARQRLTCTERLSGAV